MEVTKNQIDLMKHTMQQDRNWFGTSLDCDDSREFEKLVKLGLAVSRKPESWMGDEILYHLTDEGKSFLDNIPVPPVKKLTRSQKRYQAYLHSECSESFTEWIKFGLYKTYEHSRT